MARQDAIRELRRAFDVEAYEYLLVTHLLIADKVEKAVAEGHSPEYIRQEILKHTGREEIAQRCKLAALWLNSSGE